MAITISTTARNTQADAICGLVDDGSGNPEGQFILMDSGDTEVATLTFSNPAFLAAASGVATADTITDDTSATGGTVALYKVVDRDGTEIWRGTVTNTGGGGDIEMSNVIVGAGDKISATLFTWTQPATV